MNNVEKQHISKLDASMARCGVSLIFDYRFTGSVDTKKLATSVKAVLGNTPRLQRAITANDRYIAKWQTESLKIQEWFITKHGDFDEVSTEVFQSLGQNCEPSLPPMFFVLVASSTRSDAFMLLQCVQHSYCDGRGATMLFNQVMKYYNASLSGDAKIQQDIIQILKNMISPAPDDIYALTSRSNQKWLNIGRWQHLRNTLALMSYKTQDKGQLATPKKQLSTQLLACQNEIPQPQKHQFNIQVFIEHCQKHSPELSPNNIVFALIAKAMGGVNPEYKKLEQPNNISFRVMVDILNVGLRRKLFGNYIAYLPVTVDVTQSVADIAVEIRRRIYEAKLKRQDVSMYKMLEFALGSGMANKSGDPISYIVSNNDNLFMSSHPNFMQGAKCEKFDACANAAPTDIRGAQLNNKPTLCFNLTPAHELFIGFFNTVTDPQINIHFLEQINQILAQFKPALIKN